jgi:HprK-related kinase A
MNVGGLSTAAIRAELAAAGLALSIPPITVRLRSPLAFLADQIHSLYRDYEFVPSDAYADIDIRMLPVNGLRRWAGRQIQFVVDGVTPFEAFPLEHALPMFEWGLNWVVSHRLHGHLLLHCAVAARDGHAVLFPAWPGSGKSTLSAALACSGWRFLSDEYGIVTLDDARLLPFVRPVALKNESIDVMRAFAPEAFIGPVFPQTRKGTVAHLRPPEQSVRRGSDSAVAGAIVFPDFQRGEATSVKRVPSAAAFLKLAGNAFNYEVVGEPAFRAVAKLVRSCSAWILRYSDLAAARAALDDILREAAP